MKKLTEAIVITALLALPISAYAEQKKAPPTEVVVTEVKLKDFSDEIEALGTLKAKESVELTSAVTEIVTKINFEDNQRVKKGDILLEMDASEEIAEITEQRSFREEAQRQVNRLSPLVERGAASVSTLGENKRDLQGAQARVRAIQSRINQRILKAPFDGVLGLRNISVGALAQPGSLITTIDDDSVMKLDFSVPEIFLSTLKKGLIIEAMTEAYPDKIFKGEISNVDSRIDPITRSIEARALIDNAEKLLKPGLLMQIELQKNPRKTFLIPEEALIANGPNNFVFVINEQLIAEKRKVELGARRFGEAEIVSGLEENEKIVTQGTLKVRPDGKVKIKAVEEDGESIKDLLDKSKAPKEESDI